VPIAVITLVDVDRVIFLNKHGIDATEAKRNDAFCAYTIVNEYQDDLLYVPDATVDERFCDFPVVANPESHLHFYCGTPIRYENIIVGTFCIFDTHPRHLSLQEQAVLRDMGRVISALVSEKLPPIWEEEILLAGMVTKTLDVIKPALDETKSWADKLHQCWHQLLRGNSSVDWKARLNEYNIQLRRHCDKLSEVIHEELQILRERYLLPAYALPSPPPCTPAAPPCNCTFSSISCDYDVSSASLTTFSMDPNPI